MASGVLFPLDLAVCLTPLHPPEHLHIAPLRPVIFRYVKVENILEGVSI